MIPLPYPHCIKLVMAVPLRRRPEPGEDKNISKIQGFPMEMMDTLCCLSMVFYYFARE